VIKNIFTIIIQDKDVKKSFKTYFDLLWKIAKN
jgi:hypothetical protein